MIFDTRINILNEISKEKLISAPAVNIAEFLCGLEKNLSQNEIPALAAAAALAFERAASGSICLTKEDVGNFIKTNSEILSKITFPDWNEITNILPESSCCTTDPASVQRPLVLSGDRIYFYKYWLYEDLLAEKVLNLSCGTGKYAGHTAEIKAVFAKLFDVKSDEQQKAAETVIGRRFSVITGGPGTGKTTTVAKIIAGILSACEKARIILAAPTGKAAARMTEALKNSVEDKNGNNNFKEISMDIRRKILSLEGQTIHRILDKKFRKPEKNKENPICADLIIVDEASMIDIAMFSELLDALAEDTSLILLGDKDQLASVDVGNVLADICSCRELLPEGTVSELKISRRFNDAPGIGELAKAVNKFDEHKTANEIRDICNKYSYLKFTAKTLKNIVEAAAENYKFLSDTTLSPETILDKLNNFKILCPSKEDTLGIEKLNDEIEKAIVGKDNYDACYNGRPIMITRNDYDNTRLVNGDCGVILKRDGATKAWFKQNGSTKSFNISELPAFETVYAMTIHKSQGSEYGSVLVVLPEKDMQILTKELLYTAITRAKKNIEIVSSEEVLQSTLERSAARRSGFEEALRKRKQA